MARLCCLFLLLTSFFATNASASVTDFIDFNSSGDLAAKFTDDGAQDPAVSHNATAGLSGSGCIQLPGTAGTNECWTTKTGYSVTGAGDVYTFSAYFVNNVLTTGGYGGFGFTQNGSNVADSNGAPLVSLGMSFHGGGGMFINNQAQTPVSWDGGDMVAGLWYYMVLRIEAKENYVYDMNFKIYNANPDGTLGALKTERNHTVTNSTIGSLSTLHGYLSVRGQRMQYIDNYKIELGGDSTIIEAGMPFVTTSDVSAITATTATAGGNVTDENGNAVTARGVCWSTSAEPTLTDSCTEDGPGWGAFTSSLTGLSSGTEYHVRSYATNGIGTSYGSEKVFSEPPYTVTYDGNGSTGGLVPTDNNTYITSAPVTVLGNTEALVKTGLSFAGWNAAANGSGTSYAPDATFTMGSSNVTLYAQWTTLSTYTVTYDGNGATTGSAPAAQTKTQGIDLTLATNSGNLAKTGFTFAGWNTAIDGTGTTYTVGATYSTDAALVLYAKWTALLTYAVTYDSNGATSGSAPAAQTKTQGIDLTLATNSGNLAKTGFTFAGWNTAIDGTGTTYTVGATYSTDAALTLYAKWTANDYTVTYNGNGSTGGSVPTDSNTYNISAEVTVLGNTGILVQTGYVFTGWNTAANGSGSSYSDGGTFAMGGSNVTLYAQWTISKASTSKIYLYLPIVWGQAQRLQNTQLKANNSDSDK